MKDVVFQWRSKMAKKSMKTWGYAPKRPSKGKLPDELKAEVEVQASELVEKVLKLQTPAAAARAKVQLHRRSMVQMTGATFTLERPTPAPA